MSIAIIGIGIDIVEIERIRLACKKDENFAKRILHPDEFKTYSNYLSRQGFAEKFLAKRFASKEAFVKALGTGFRGITFQEILVTNGVLGEPMLKLERKALEIAKNLGVIKAHISLTDEKRYACASVLLEGNMSSICDNKSSFIDISLKKRFDHKTIEVFKENMYNENNSVLNNVPLFADKKDDYENLYAIIEIPQDSACKYEVCKKTGLISLDRFMSSAFRYPCNYGYFNQTLAEDSDPVDVLVWTPYPLQSGCILKCHPLYKLEMYDSGEIDHKIIAIPHLGSNADSIPESMLNKIKHFFKYYKELENKPVEVKEYSDKESAIDFIKKSHERYINCKRK